MRGRVLPAAGAALALAAVVAGLSGCGFASHRDGAGAPVSPSGSSGPSAPSTTGSGKPAPSPSRTVNGRAQPPTVRVPESASGTYAVAKGTQEAPAGARGTTIRYAVEVERGLPFKVAEFAATVHQTRNDPRSWGHGGQMRFVRVDHGPVAFRVALSSPALTDRLCAPLNTGGELSCRQGVRSVINARRWGTGVPWYKGDLAAYREYVINHEVGHALGHGHEQCPGPGRRAPVMVQQTKSLYGCRPNPWPFPSGSGDT
ncbi:DUF3152 domain-containing protein [Actinomadura rupiterrae]|uniref:DUF3152 domain-containing protein n=1 Tax=Actinomadura rupiterrae TaxID=559627 RepID=UPI0020A383AA|nr:DUF3152 domain-containing protein [Actinomadura rupiterrae]MCP2339860.1 hypothetical protein [Actinomadura rupiterrae]